MRSIFARALVVALVACLGFSASAYAGGYGPAQGGGGGGGGGVSSITGTTGQITVTGTTTPTLSFDSGGMTVGSPTGGKQGAGTINVSGAGYYVNGVLLSASTPTLGAVVNAGNTVNGTSASAALTWATGGTYTATAAQIRGPTDTGLFVTSGSPVSVGSGQGITITSGAANGTNPGGPIAITGGVGGPGASVTITAGAGTNVATGGPLSLNGGAGSGAAAGGAITITSGAPGSTGTGGAITLSIPASTSSAVGGAFSATAGAGIAGGVGGSMTFAAGAGGAAAGGLFSASGGAGAGTDKAAGGVTLDTGACTGIGGGTITFKLAPTIASGTTSSPSVALYSMTNGVGAINGAAHGETFAIGSQSELLTLSTVGLTTQTTGNLLPANSFILAVDTRVTTTITTTTNWAVGDATTTSRFSAANATLTAGTAQVGITQLGASGVASGLQTTASKVQITCTGANPGAGVVRITVHYIAFGSPTS